MHISMYMSAFESIYRIYIAAVPFFEQYFFIRKTEPMTRIMIVRMPPYTPGYWFSTWTYVNSRCINELHAP